MSKERNNKISDHVVKPPSGKVDLQKRELIFFEEDNPRCVVNLLPPLAKKAAKLVPMQVLAMSTHELRRRFEPNDMDEQLRLAFWDEYFIAADNDRLMRMDAVFGRVCSKEHWYKSIVANPIRFSYILRPPEEYMIKIRGLLEIGLNRFSEIIQLPLQDKSGNVDSKLIGQIIQIVSLLDNRVRGAIPQKLHIEGKQLNLNMNYEAPKTVEDIDKQMRNIEKEISQLNGIEVSTMEAIFPGSLDEQDGSEAEAINVKATEVGSHSGAEEA